MKIYSIESKDVSESTPLYNFVLTGDRTYFADGYLVHNKNACADWPGYSCIRNSVAPYLLVPPGDPSGNVLPNGCSNIGAIYNQAPTSTPIWMGNCGGSYVYDGCYSGGVNGSIGIRACGNNVPN